MNVHIMTRSAQVLLAATFSLGSISRALSAQDTKPTIVLVHGAFAESASWDRVIDPLRAAGHPVIALIVGPAMSGALLSVRRLPGPDREIR